MISLKKDNIVWSRNVNFIISYISMMARHFSGGKRPRVS